MTQANKKWRLAAFVSGGGSNFQALLDATQNGTINGKFVAVVSNKPDAYGLTRAKNANVPTFVFEPADFENRTVMCAKTAKKLKELDVDLICLAGYLLKLETCLIRSFPNRIINIHPALLPKFGGKGMYGKRVHQAVIDAGEKESGPTVHLVDEIFDHGKPLAQLKVPVQPNDSAEDLAARVLEKEHQIYPDVVRKICAGEIDLDQD